MNSSTNWQKDSFCSYCGHPFSPEQAWPRTCTHCGQSTFRNPLPVAIILVPVAGGLLTVRRAVAPHQGELALPGGYIDFGESWQAAGAREVYEESGLRLKPTTITHFATVSAPDSTLLVFGLAERVAEEALPPFKPTPESSERVIVRQQRPLAFPLHTEMMRRFLT